jgi:glycosyltransferase involved in cell wall biosynthesis
MPGSPKAMRVLHLSTRDISGGAARAAYRLHRGLRFLGVQSSMFVLQRRSDDPTVIRFKRPKDPIRRLRRDLRRERIKRSFESYRTSRPGGLEPFSDDRTHFGSNVLRQLSPCSVIHLHWIAGFIDYQALRTVIRRKAAVVWTFHDMNPFTGGCHYDDGCGRWRESCGACPQLGSTDPEDLSYKIWQRKREIFSRIDPGHLSLVAPSRWLAGEVKRSSLLGKFSVSVIPYGLDTDVFTPQQQCIARDVLGVPANARTILFVSDSLSTRRKGMDILTRALREMLPAQNLFFLSLGSDAPQMDIPIPHLHLDYVKNDQQLALVYSAADVLVLPSVQDNLPNTALESLACGTPIIGFAVGGLPDIVRHGVNGLLVPAGDLVALVAAIKELLIAPARYREMSSSCRRVAVEEYSLEIQARRYIELYNQLAPNQVTSETTAFR